MTYNNLHLFSISSAHRRNKALGSVLETGARYTQYKLYPSSIIG